MKLILSIVVLAASLTGCAVVPAPYAVGPQPVYGYSNGYGGNGYGGNAGYASPGGYAYGPGVAVVPAPVVVAPRWGFGVGRGFGWRGRHHH